MGVTTEFARRTEPLASPDVARKHIRGSSLLLAGRLVSGGINFLAQVLVARYLSTSDYGNWAYALSVVALFQMFSTLGLDRATTRFVPHYHEKGEYGKITGTVLLVVGAIVAISILVITALQLFPQALLRLTRGEQEPLVLLSLMIFLVPLQALDDLFTGLFASFASPRAIFFRKHLLGPGLKLAVVLALLWRGSRVMFLAAGYVAASLLGILIYSVVLINLLRRRGLLAHLKLSEVRFPAPEILAFTFPLLTTDLVNVLMNSANTMLLGYFRSMEEVAFFRVVEPAVTWNMIVMRSFSLLFMPAVARLFARRDDQGIHDLYWSTAIWMTILTFPIFAMTFSASGPLMALLYGKRYEPAAGILAILALGKYFHVALGFNAVTLQVVGKMRWVVAMNLFAAITDIVLCLLLIPRFGAMGAAVSATSTLILYNLMMQAGLRASSRVGFLDTRYASLYALIAISATALLCLQFISLKPAVALSIAGLVSFLVIAATGKILRIEETFPELLRVPLMRRLFA